MPAAVEQLELREPSRGIAHECLCLEAAMGAAQVIGEALHQLLVEEVFELLGHSLAVRRWDEGFVESAAEDSGLWRTPRLT
ncbi:MAG: hypothetical protein ACT4OZ_10750 [Gemmatimonadota bacterium]